MLTNYKQVELFGGFSVIYISYASQEEDLIILYI